MKVDRSVRLSQSISPFGVGAIYDALGESFVACDTTYWKGKGEPLVATRLSDALGVGGFRIASSRASWLGDDSKGPGVPYFRFPQWLFCGRCRVMVRWKYTLEVEGEPARCQNCQGAPKLIPMRFVAVCGNAHLMDVPWDRWAHSRAGSPEEKQCQNRRLTFRTLSGRGGGLASLEVRCASCSAGRSLEGITSKDALKHVGVKCLGRQPWQPNNAETDCPMSAQVVQRGASNVYFANVRSAIDIPPHSSYEVYGQVTLEITNDPVWQVLMSSPSGPMVDGIISVLATNHGASEVQVRQIVAEELQQSGYEVDECLTQTDDSEVGLLEGEWNALLTPNPEQDHRDRFVTDHVTLLPEAPIAPALRELDKSVDRVVLVNRLREVRALTGFSRLEPQNNLVPPDLGRGLDWLPAIEVYGEGLFFTLNEERLRQWENREDIQARAEVLEKRRQQSFYRGFLSDPVSPRFLLIHSLAHLLIRQLAFECGYSSSSLRERIYAHRGPDATGRAGILVYTAAGDVEGTLGGLARQGRAPRLADTLISALRAGAWCSLDPICGESNGQGLNAMNLSACHACTLVAETSCTHMNSLLDRGMVTGTPGKGSLGFFTPVLDSALHDSAGIS